MNKGEATRERILEAAASLFNQKGFEGCSMADIMEATGLEKGGLYRHFPTKERLAVEALQFSLKRVTRTHVEGLDAIEGAVEQLRYLVRHFVDEPSSVPGGCPMFNTAVDCDDGNPALRAMAQQALHTWKGRLVKIVQEGLLREEIAPGTQPSMVANTMMAALEGAQVLSRLEGNTQPLRDAAVMVDRMLVGLKAG